MKVTKEIIHSTVKEVAGEEAINIIEYLKSRKNVSEFKIAEVTGYQVNQTRKLLYRMYEHNLVTYKRKKDKEKGWSISYWTFNIKRVKGLVQDLKKKKLEQLRDRLNSEQTCIGGFYICPKFCIRLNFEDAFEKSFKCPECDSVLSKQDNAKTIEHLKTEIKKLES